MKDERPDTPLILACYWYIQLNPVLWITRLSIIGRVFETMHNGKYPVLLIPYDIYERLDFSERSRQQNHRELFRHQLDSEIIDETRLATNGNFALASDMFREQVSNPPARRVEPGLSGRPRTQN